MERTRYYGGKGMLIRRSPDLRYSQVTPRETYLNRRSFLAGSVALGALAKLSAATAGSKLAAVKSKFSTDEKPTPLDAITHYNNFYEFGTDKEDPSKNAYKLRTSPWSVKVEGAVAKPTVLDLDAIFKIAPLEERIYRHRCVEAWSMVIPWIGFPLSALLNKVEPTAKAKYVAFESYYDSKTMLSPMYAGIRFPYMEGLRMDEAMHPLALLAVGLYGETLPNQDGAPFRLVVPWKYGFKSIKSIVKIRLVEKEPSTTWVDQNSRWYGFYSNVNPEVNPVRWDQRRERRIGEFRMRDTTKFNGYGDQVAGIYNGMDLQKYY
jgi:sulfoxide reductase catalytic subunit YedY